MMLFLESWKVYRVFMYVNVLLLIQKWLVFWAVFPIVFKIALNHND